jgi:hypothetical protein
VAHPFHRSWTQAHYDFYVANEVFPFIDSQCRSAGFPIATLERRSPPARRPTPFFSKPVWHELAQRWRAFVC